MIVVDVETTGFSPSRHAIVSIGAVEFENLDNQFYGECRIDADTVVDPGALAVNGFEMADISDASKPTLAELIVKFNEWVMSVSDRTLGGHNTGFDDGMLRAAYRKANIEYPFGYMSVDLFSIVYSHMMTHGLLPRSSRGFFSIKADGAYEYVGLPKEPAIHNGLTGAKMEAEAMHRLIYGKPGLQEFEHFPLPSFQKENTLF